ncbi:MAG TPA: adenylyltransferase/cytidyltransferase family protein [Candidatus Bathyarchaeia archaeon]|nr:adenylyltransferase/cytidyltransferase family protein [Candidatus Bathyarchaeia archaeon]
MVRNEGKNLKKKGKIVLASGTFDLLHLGHVKYLEEAKKAGGKNARLMVIIARDKTVEKRKGDKPVMPEEHRRALVESLKVVDEAILGYEDFDIGSVITELRPNVIAVGYDQEGIEKQVRKVVAEKKYPVEVVRIEKFGKDELNSSLKIKKRISQICRR